MEHGEIYMLDELRTIADSWRKCIRVTGVVQSFDANQRMCVLSHKGLCVRIDTSLVESSIFRVDSVCQIIGTIRQMRGQARVDFRSSASGHTIVTVLCLYLHTGL